MSAFLYLHDRLFVDSNGCVKHLYEWVLETPALMSAFWLLSAIGMAFSIPMSSHLFWCTTVSAMSAACTNHFKKHSTIDNVRDVVKDVSTEVRDVMYTANATIQQSAESITEVANAVTSNVERILSGNFDSEITLDSIAHNATYHSVGIGAAVSNALNAEGPATVIRSGVSIASMLGLEKSFIRTIMSRFGASVSTSPTGLTVVTAQRALDDIQIGSSQGAKLAGVLGLLSTFLGIEISGIDVGESIRKAVASRKSFEELWQKVEEALNDLGLIETGKYKQIKDLYEKIQDLTNKFQEFSLAFASNPQVFLYGTQRNAWKKFMTDFSNFMKIMQVNKDAVVKNSPINQQVILLWQKILEKDGELDVLAGTSNIRPEPVGINIVGDSHVGKSTLAKELRKRVDLILEQRAAADESLIGLRGIKDSPMWNIQFRDEYDQGYGGQEWVYADDGWSQKDCKDHAMWLTFMSNSAVGTVQANLNQKGSPFRARAVIISSNTLPTKSSTINNVDALQNRFPVTIGVRNKRGVKKPEDGSYDPDFKHIEYHVGPCAYHCFKDAGNSRTSMQNTTCNWRNHAGYDGCEMKDMTLQQIAEDIASRMILAERKYQNMMHNTIGDTRQPHYATVTAQRGSVDSDGEESDYDTPAEPPALAVPEPQSFMDATGVNLVPIGMNQRFEHDVSQTDAELAYLINSAYASPPVKTVSDVRVQPWANLLVHKDGLSFVDWCIQTNTTTFGEFYDNISDFHLTPRPDGDEEEVFVAAYRSAFSEPTRLETNDYTQVVVCDRLVAATVLVMVPYWDGHGNILEMPDEVRVQLQSVYRDLNTNVVLMEGNQDGRFYRLRRNVTLTLQRPITPRPGDDSYRMAVNIVVRAVLAGRWLNDGGLGLMMWMYQVSSYRPIRATSNRLTNFVTNHAHSRIAQVVNPVVRVTFQGLELVEQILSSCARVCEFISSAIGNVLIRLGDWLGLPIQQWLDNIWVSISLDVASAYIGNKIWIMIVSAIAAMIYAVFKYLFKKSETKSKDAPRTARLKSRISDHYNRECGLSLHYSGHSGKRVTSRRMRLRPLNQNIMLDKAIYEQLTEKTPDYEYIVLDNTSPCWECFIGQNGDKIGGNSLVTVIEYEDGTWYIVSTNHAPADLPLVDPLVETIYSYTEERLQYSKHGIMFDIQTNGVGTDAHFGMGLYEPTETYKIVRSEKLTVTTDVISVGDNATARISYTCKWGYKEFEHLIHNMITSALDAVQKHALKIHMWYMWGYIVDGYVEGQFVLISTSSAMGTHNYLTKALAKEVCDAVRTGSGTVKVDRVSTDCIEQTTTTVLPTPAAAAETPVVSTDAVVVTQLHGYEHSSNTLETIKLRHLVKVECFRSADAFSGRKYCLAGMGHDWFVFANAHVGLIGDVCLIKQLGDNKRKTIAAFMGCNDTIWRLGVITARLPDYDVCIISLARESKYVGQLLLKFKNTIAPSRIQCSPFPDLSKHVLRQNALPMDSLAMQYYAHAAMAVVGRVRWRGKTRLHYLTNKDNEVFETYAWEFTFGQSFQTLGKDGDCGSPLILLGGNSHVVGLHRFANSQTEYPAVFTKEIMLTLQSAATSVAIVTNLNVREEEILSDEVDFSLIKAGYGHEQFSSWPAIEWVPPEKDDIRQYIVPGMADDLPDGPMVLPIGRLNMTHRAAPYKAPKWYKSPWFGCFELRLIPSVISPFDTRLKAKLPKNRSGEPSLLMTPQSVLARKLPKIDMKVFRKAVHQLCEYYTRVLYDEDMHCEGSIYDLFDIALNGAPNGKFITGIEIKTSSGAPYNCTPGMANKSDFICIGEDGKRHFKPDQNGQFMQRLVRKKLLEAQAGRRMYSLCASKLKDCLVKTKHVENGKTRVFNCVPLESILASRAIFNKFKEAYMKHGDELAHCIGIDPVSFAWQRLYDALSLHSNIYDEDFSTFDKRNSSAFLRGAGIIIINAIENSKRGHDGWSAARYVLFEEKVSTICLDNETVYMSEHGNKSGDDMTTIINNISHHLMYIYIWMKVTGTDLYTFNENVVCRFFGDDGIVTVSDKYKYVFNFEIVAREFALIGHEMTPAKKMGDASYRFLSWDDVQFLKRNFKRYDGLIVGPLDTSAIEGVFNWTQLQEYDWDWKGVIENKCVEALLHGEAYYTYFTQRLLARTYNRNFPESLKEYCQVLTRSFADAWQALKDDKLRLIVVERQNNTTADLISDAKQVGLPIWKYVSSLGVQDISTINVQLASLTNSVNDLTTKHDTLEMQVTQLNDQLNTLGRTVQDKLNTLSTQIGQLTSDITELTAITSQLNTLTSSLSTSMNSVKQDVSSLSSRLTTAETTIINLNTLTSSLSSSLNSVKQDVSSLLTRTTSAETRLTSLESDVQALKTKGSVDIELRKWLLDYLENVELLSLTADAHVGTFVCPQPTTSGVQIGNTTWTWYPDIVDESRRLLFVSGTDSYTSAVPLFTAYSFQGEPSSGTGWAYAGGTVMSRNYDSTLPSYVYILEQVTRSFPTQTAQDGLRDLLRDALNSTLKVEGEPSARHGVKLAGTQGVCRAEECMAPVIVSLSGPAETWQAAEVSAPPPIVVTELHVMATKDDPEYNAYKDKIVVFNRLRQSDGSGMIADGKMLADALASGAIKSEVGPPKKFSSPCGKHMFFQLRGHLATKYPRHCYGGMHLGQAFSAFVPIAFTVPAAGSSIIIDPYITEQQRTLMNWFRGKAANVLYTIHVPAPLGVSVELEVTAPEFDPTVKTRGVRYKVSQVPIMNVAAGWCNETPYMLKGEPQPSSCGLSIKLTTIQDVTTEDVNTPLQGIVFCCVKDVKLSCFDVSSLTSIGYVRADDLSFNRHAAITPPDTGGDDSGDTDEGAGDGGDDDAGGTGTSSRGLDCIVVTKLHMMTDTAQPTGIADVEIPAAPAVEGTGQDVNETAPAPEATGKPNDSRPQTAASNIQMLSTKWQEIATISLSDADVGVSTVIKIQPAADATTGEGVSKPFLRNAFAIGVYREGFQRGLEFMIQSVTTQKITGLLQVWERTAVTQGVFGSIKYMSFGQHSQMIRPPWDVYEQPDLVYLNREYVACSDAVCGLTITPLVVNVIDGSQAASITIFGRVCDTAFVIPTKPQPALPSVYVSTEVATQKWDKRKLDCIKYIGSVMARHGHNLRKYDKGPVIVTRLNGWEEHQAAFEDGSVDWEDLEAWGTITPSECTEAMGYYAKKWGGAWAEAYDARIAPPPTTSGGITGNISTEPEVEALDQDMFWIKAASIDAPVGETSIVQIDPWDVTDLEGAGGLSPISEKATRYANIAASWAGPHGPAWGKYRLVIRLTQDETCDIAHVSLPADMNVQVTTRLFGLDSLLSIAGSVLTSVGGPVIAGGIQTIADAVQDVPILGDLAQGASSLVSSVFGRSQETEQVSYPEDDKFTGYLYMPRHVCFLKTTDEDTENRYTTTSILITPLNYRTGGSSDGTGKTVHVDIYVRGGAGLASHRVTFDRGSFVPTAQSALWLNLTDFGYVMARLASSKKKEHHQLAETMFSFISSKWNTTTDVRVDVLRLRSLHLTANADMYKKMHDVVRQLPNRGR